MAINFSAIQINARSFVKRHIECQRGIYISKTLVVNSIMSAINGLSLVKKIYSRFIDWLKYFRDTLNRGSESSNGFGL